MAHFPKTCKRLILFSCVAILFLQSTKKGIAQDKTGIGLSGIYNIQSTGIGVGLRVQVPAGERLSFVPQLMYFPFFNIVHEAFGGLNLHYDLIVLDKVKGYITAGGFLNYWINSESSGYLKAKSINIIPEAGGGFLFGEKCFRPFIEQRYNFKWQEGSIHFGLIWYPGCGGSSDGLICPAYF